jgi:hypothetical protein
LRFFRSRARSQMATPFNPSVITSSTMLAAAAFEAKSLPGRDTQLNAWMGNTVNGSDSHCMFTNGNFDCSSAAGWKAMNVSAPIVISGAVSPSAREMPMMTPVNTPGMAAGNT